MDSQGHIHNVPIELLLRFFRSVIGTRATPSASGRNDHFLFQYIAATHLRLVCRRWNQFILSDPWFWSQIDITIGSKEYCPRPPPRLVEKWLERSGTHPLDISLTFPNSFRFYESEEAVEKRFNNRMESLVHHSRMNFRWRTRLPDWLGMRIEPPTYKSLLHSGLAYRDLKHFMTQYDRMHNSRKWSNAEPRESFWKELGQGYYTFNIWPVLQRASHRWRSLALISESNVMTEFCKQAFCNVRELSELTLAIQDHSIRANSLHIPTVFERIPSVRRLRINLNLQTIAPWFGDSYSRIPRSTLHAVSYLEVLNNLRPEGVLALMEICENATVIKMGAINGWSPAMDTTTFSQPSPFLFSSLNALILCITWHPRQVFDYLDLPNLRLLSITVPAWTYLDTMKLICSFASYIPTFKSLQMFRLTHEEHELSFYHLLQLFSLSQIQSIPVLEVEPLYIKLSGYSSVHEDVALRDILRINYSCNRHLLAQKIQQGQRGHVIGWVDETALEEWEDKLREWGMQLRIVDAHRSRAQRV